MKTKNEIIKLVESIQKEELNMFSDIESIQLTVAADREDIKTWDKDNQVNSLEFSYQTGNNEFFGAAYFKNTWGVSEVFRDSIPEDVADEILNQLVESVYW